MRTPLLFALLALSLPFMPAFAKSNKIITPKGFDNAFFTKEGCIINNPFPEEGESVSWSGDCVNGLAEGFGVLQWYSYDKPADKYVGEYRAGRINGVGQYTQASGIIGTGFWQDDKMTGLGESVNTKGKWRGDAYVGEFKNNKWHGKGVYYAYIHNAGFQNQFGDKFLNHYADKLQRKGDYVIMNVVYDEGESVAICDIETHESCR